MNFENPFNQASKIPEKAEIDKNLVLEEQEEENSENEKDGMKNKIKINYGGKEYELESTSYEFEYPERIKKETGILGYKRCIVPREEILNIKKSQLQEEGINVKDCKDFESINEVLRKKRNEKRKEFGIVDGLMFYEQSKETQQKSKNYFDNTREGGAIKFDVNLEGVFYNLDLFFSNGEFPYRTFNHGIGSHHKDREKMLDSFVKNKFFLQKIYDFDLTSEIKLGNRQDTFDSTEDIVFGVYEKNTNTRISETSSHDLGGYKEEMKNNQVYFVGSNAFNTAAGDFWRSKSGLVNFGFTLNDELFKNYVKKIYEIFLKDNNDTQEELIGIEQIIRMIAFCDENFYTQYQKFFKYSDGDKTKEDEEELKKNFLKIISDFLPNINLKECILNKKEMNITPYNNNNERFFNKLNEVTDEDNYDYYGKSSQRGNKTINFLKNTANRFTDTGNKAEEICIPIFINNDEIPQISWGHAKYASFYNQKGFNFIEFKHAEELPKPSRADEHVT